MKSTILPIAVRVILPLTLLYSVFLLLRGHNEPGGGFVGGLVAAAAWCTFALAEGRIRARAMLHADPSSFALLGLGIAVLSGLAPLLAGAPYLTGTWYAQPLAVVGKVGTPLLFDVGVYLLVFGVTTRIVFALLDE